MILYDSTGRPHAMVHERPVMPANLARFASWGGHCVSCGEMTIREHCTAYYGASGMAAPRDQEGGYYTTWTVRCLACELATVSRVYGLAPFVQKETA